MSAGFVAAGTKCTLASLWSVNDGSTSSIMQDFYALLKKGNQKNIAISQAKKNYLMNADNFHAHPFFWGGFIVSGDETALKIGSSYAWLLYLGGAMVLFLAGFYWKKVRR